MRLTSRFDRGAGMKTKNIALYGMLAATALLASYVESRIPVFFAVPGMKLGLTNVLVLIALYRLGNRGAMAVNLLRILLSSILFGSLVSLWYSLAGGMLSTLVMIVFRHFHFHTVTTSVLGGISHNIGQILVAVLLVQTVAVGWYLVILWFTGMASGALIGILGAELLKRLPKSVAAEEGERKA